MADARGRLPEAMAALPGDLAGRLWRDAATVRAKAGQTVLEIGAPSTQVYIVLEGKVQVALYSLGGHEVILRDLAAGALFGELAAIDERPRSATITALSDCQLASLPASAFRAAVAESSDGALWLAARLAMQIRSLTEKVFELNALRVRERLHCELLRLCEGLDGQDATIEPCPTHAELAARIGTHREAVTREMGFLAQRGIAVQRARQLTITDLPALRQLVRDAVGGISIFEDADRDRR
ncbi:cAMP-binding domain of CRP or a regulatory subunit of cAMP-dependent protein kinases [Sphingomonas laterariae]|uniref:cAMP-binding domain of CRP or a regulatory subunit of cAMP-dependent protein kinases n=1 Tax=Edaphosphingomonas laterariae TaxID=861865 RepID=A0A239CF10_9SPHN|nr:Crp/Fnr family transcriptional regulator [Sphingomonas laterariae]SNS18044.1 cAMP-binding domain of CRP or a regulatory subunit of cAMP-dependent protein kinases [Sphingomonas laterariae]